MFRILSKETLTILKTESFQLSRAFSKIYNFKEKYPILYSHIHPDSLPLVNKECIDSKTVVKWFCPKGPDHVWESDIALRIRSLKRRKECSSSLSLITSCLLVLQWENGFGDKQSCVSSSGIGKGVDCR